MPKKSTEHLKPWGTAEGQDLMRAMLKGEPLTEKDSQTAERFRQINQQNQKPQKPD